MKYIKVFIPVLILTLAFNQLFAEKVIDEIYAVVNDEIITYSQLMTLEKSLVRELSQKYQGEEFDKVFKEMKATIMKNLIDQKLLYSKAKSKNYDVENDVEMIISEIKKQNNIQSDEQMAQALKAQGLTMEKFKEQQRMVRMNQKLIFEEIGSLINIDNAEIMEYYKNNTAEYTLPMTFNLNCIFLDSSKYPDNILLNSKKDRITESLTDDNFEEIAKEYSELPGTDNHVLGEFKKGELHGDIEAAAQKLKEGEHSGWIETGSGWYIIQLVKLTPPKLVEYKEVRDSINEKLTAEKRGIEVAKYVEKLKKESYIKIFKEYK